MCIPTEQGRLASEAYEQMLSTEYTVEIGGQTFTKEQFMALQQGGQVTTKGNDFEGTEAPSVTDLAIEAGAVVGSLDKEPVGAGA